MWLKSFGLACWLACVGYFKTLNLNIKQCHKCIAWLVQTKSLIN
uniref:Uncharacterized protein n=1 Tax=Anguilla anguilla TaxID=7936 RepID=A0A0E9TTR5_ANGAN